MIRPGWRPKTRTDLGQLQRLPDLPISLRFRDVEVRHHSVADRCPGYVPVQQLAGEQNALATVRHAVAVSLAKLANRILELLPHPLISSDAVKAAYEGLKHRGAHC